MSRLYVGKKTPYTKIGIRRAKCFCGNRAAFQWSTCANGHRYIPVCKECDLRLNRLILDFLNHPYTDTLMVRYERSVADVQ